MKKPVLLDMDCFMIPVADLEEAVLFYGEKLGLDLVWRKNNRAGFALGGTELVVHTNQKKAELDIKVDSVVDALEDFTASGGTLIHGPFDIDIGKAAVVADPWGNSYILLDSSKGNYKTDAQKNVIGVE